MRGLEVRLLGPLELLQDGQPITGFESARVRALLVYLAVEAERAHSREALGDLLWPSLPSQPARENLRQALANLRRVLPASHPESPFVLVTRGTVQWNAASDHWLDVAAFSALLHACAHHPHRHGARCVSCAARREQALALYRDDFLANFYLADSEPFEEWALLKREHLHQRALALVEQLASYHERRGAYEEARECWLRGVTLAPWYEDAHRALMRLHMLLGEKGAALAQFQSCRRALLEELGVEPAPLTRSLYEQLRALPSGSQAVKDLAAAAPARARHNLPAQPTRFIGRRAVLAHLGELLEDPARRLVTLTGAPGIGKTRLALEVAAEQVHSFADGVCFVSLASLSDPALVASALARALSIQEGGPGVEEQLKGYLREKELLLVLDNFEHLLPAAPLVVELLSAAPRLQVTVTSRQPLGLDGEWVYVVPSLAVPDSGDPLALAQLLENEAVQLFVQRAEAAKAGFAVTDKTGQSIATLCVQLDGLPLAIELAAAHAHLLSPRAMLRRLERRFDWLATGARDAPERHQTLRNALDWSYQRLGKDGRALFRHLGVFRGGCTLQAATTVCAALDLDVQTTLELLVAQNLVQQGEMAGEQRFVMLESIRQYALQRLRARGEETAARRRHALYYLALAETAEPELWGPQQVEWANQLEQELDNLRAAMSWSSSEGGDAALALAFAGATWHFWSFRSLLSEGRYWLSVLLSANPAPTPARIKALNELGVLAWFQGDIQAILPPLEEALGIAREIGDPFGLGMTLTSLGAVHHIIGADDRAISLLQESLTQALENQDKLVAHHAYFWLAQVAWMQERYDHAFMLLQNSLSLRRELGDSWSIAYALYMLGKWTRKQGNYEEADALLGESLMLRQQLNDRIGIIWNLDELACLATAQGLWQRGVRLFGAAEAIRTEIGSALLARWQEDVMGVVAEARGALGPAVFEQAWIEGQAMRLEEAVTFALSTI